MTMAVETIIQAVSAALIVKVFQLPAIINQLYFRRQMLQSDYKNLLSILLVCLIFNPAGTAPHIPPGTAKTGLKNDQFNLKPPCETDTIKQELADSQNQIIIH
jgi:hypothetical protein